MREIVDDRLRESPGGDDAGSRTSRLARYDTVSNLMASLDDQQVMVMLDDSVGIRVGMGGTTASIAIDGVPVFVKKVPLTDVERRSEYIGSTANLFDLPTFYQYGLGSAGFGTWREVAVHAMTTDWVLKDRCQGFPILYHWRMLPLPPAPFEPARLEWLVARWEHSAAVRARLTAINEASACVVLFMEHIPHTVDSWLTAQTAAGIQAAASAYALVDRNLQTGVAFLRSQGILHFDAHFDNLLTDGRRVYFADFGLATCAGFDLSAAELAFFRQRMNYDRCYTVTHLTSWLISNLLHIPWEGCFEHLRDNGDGGVYAALPATATDIIARHRNVALIMGEFYRKLWTTGLSTPYPAEELRRAGADAPMFVKWFVGPDLRGWVVAVGGRSRGRCSA